MVALSALKATMSQRSHSPAASACIPRIRCVREFLPWFFLHENVLQFPDDFMSKMLSDLYIIESVVIDARDLGLPVSRKRRYTLCRRKDRLQRHGSTHLFVLPAFHSDL